MMTASIGTVPPTAANAATPAARSPRRRRRLWNLPTHAHELLLANSFSPDELRRAAARTLGRMHHGQCKLQGSDVDVLYSLVHDMGTRNPLSEAMHKWLDERHRNSLRRMTALREVPALRAAWAQALAGDDMAAGLWALLTHPLGVELEAPALYDACGWIFAHCRRSVGLSQQEVSSRDAELLARQQVDDLRQRLARHQQQAAAQHARAQAELATLRGEVARLRSAREEGVPRGQQALPPCKSHTAIVVSTRDSPVPQAATPRLPVAQVCARAATPAACVAASPAHPVQGRRVLCVGGIQHAVPHYRARIERMGGHFEHHDGGLEDSAQGLDGRLHRAEVVICQAACINHEAYRRIKRHCERTGTPCMYLERPSLSRFARALQELVMPATNHVTRHAV